jgi:hypothetical protein
LFPEGATFIPLEDEGGALCVGVLPEGAGVTGEAVVPPGCCPKITCSPDAQKRNKIARAMIAELTLRRFIKIYLNSS